MSIGAGGARMGRTADAIVVGAGPAGSVAALRLARQGVRVLLVDRAEFPRPKPCGDCLSAAASALLRRLGLLDRLLATGPALIDGWSITSPDGHTCTGLFGGCRGLAIERRVLDAELRAAALEAGAVPLEARVTDLLRDAAGRVVGVRTRTAGGASGGAADPGRELRARLVIGADGLRSVVARRLGTVRRTPRLRKVSLTTHARLLLDRPGLGQMHVLDGGCVGIAPVGHDRVNLSVVVDARHAQRLAADGAERFLRRWVARVPGLTVAALEIEEVLASGPFDWPSRGATAAGAALVGDAAGYYDPFTGQGIFHAMAAADALAGEVGPCLLSAAGAAGVGPVRADDSRQSLDRALGRYARAHHRLTAPARRAQHLIEAVLSRPAAANAAIQRLARAPEVADRLVEVTGDLRPPRALLSPRLLSSFLIPPTPEPA